MAAGQPGARIGTPQRHWPIRQSPHPLAQRKLVVFPPEAFDDAGNPDPEQAQTGESVPLGSHKTGVDMPYHETQSGGWIVIGEPEPNCQFLSLLKQPNGQF